MDGKGTAAVTDARQITASLRRVHTTMSSSVMNADEAVSVLLQDGAILEDTLQDHKYGLKGSLQTTKHRLSRIKSAETREAYMIFLSLSFFTSVVMYIIAKRTRLLTVAWLAMHGAIRGRNAITSMTARISKVEKVDFNVSAEISINLDESFVIDLSQENPPLASNGDILFIPEAIDIEHAEDSVDLSAPLTTVIEDISNNEMKEISVEGGKANFEIFSAITSESDIKYVTLPAITTELSETKAADSDAIVEESSSSSSSSSVDSTISIEVTGAGESLGIESVLNHEYQTQELSLENQVRDSPDQSKTQFTEYKAEEEHRSGEHTHNLDQLQKVEEDNVRGLNEQVEVHDVVEVKNVDQDHFIKEEKEVDQAPRTDDSLDVENNFRDEL